MRTQCLCAILALLTGAAFAPAQTPAPPDAAVLPVPNPAPVEDQLGGVDVVEPQPAEGCSCQPSNLYWISGSYLHWWAKGELPVPLLTTGSTADAIPGALGQPGTRLVVGDTDDHQPRAGARFDLGYWFGEAHDSALEASFLFLTERRTQFVPLLTPDRVLARPIMDATTGTETALLISSPNVLAGSVTASSSTDLFGGEVYLRKLLCGGHVCHLSLLAGLRQLRLEDSLEIRDTSITLGGNPVVRSDRFDSFNDFLGGQVGLRFDFVRDHFNLNVQSKLSLGSTHQSTAIDGSTLDTDVGGERLRSGGVLALPSNIGQSERFRVGVVPEFALNCRYRFTEHLCLEIGYSFLYWDAVARAGSQVDRTVNLTQVPSVLAPALTDGNRPGFFFHETDFWVQGVHFTLEFQF